MMESAKSDEKAVSSATRERRKIWLQLQTG